MNWLKTPSMSSQSWCECMGPKCKGRDEAIDKIGVCGVKFGSISGTCIINFG